MLFTRLLILFFICLTTSCTSDKEIQTPGYIVTGEVALSDELKENSGLILLNDKLVMHNDSGDDPILYIVNPKSGKIERKVLLAGARNVDMEDIAQDDTYIYVADIGNNNNTRKDLVVYRVEKKAFLNRETVDVAQIAFSYAEQTNFNRSNRKTNFDAEALVVVGDDLLLFTKNWTDNKTYLYRLPKQPGNYTLTRLAVFDVKGLVTGAAYNPVKKIIVLSGYSNYIPFIAELRGFSLETPESTELKRYNLAVPGSLQTEAIDFIAEDRYFLSAEGSGGNPPVLYNLSVE